MGSHRYGLAVHFCFVRLVGGIENDDLAASAAGPETVELAVNSFETGEQGGQFFQPFLVFRQRRDVGDQWGRRPACGPGRHTRVGWFGGETPGWQAGRLPHYWPGLAFDIVNGAVS